MSSSTGIPPAGRPRTLYTKWFVIGDQAGDQIFFFKKKKKQKKKKKKKSV
jgi:hypothetical protein